MLAWARCIEFFIMLALFWYDFNIAFSYFAVNAFWYCLLMLERCCYQKMQEYLFHQKNSYACMCACTHAHTYTSSFRIRGHLISSNVFFLIVLGSHVVGSARLLLSQLHPAGYPWCDSWRERTGYISHIVDTHFNWVDGSNMKWCAMQRGKPPCDHVCMHVYARNPFPSARHPDYQQSVFRFTHLILRSCSF